MYQKDGEKKRETETGMGKLDTSERTKAATVVVVKNVVGGRFGWASTHAPLATVLVVIVMVHVEVSRLSLHGEWLLAQVQAQAARLSKSVMNPTGPTTFCSTNLDTGILLAA